MPRQYWLLKTEPSTYAFSDLLRDGRTHWNGIRNFQARNFLKSAQKGDLALIYHSGKDKAVVGVAELTSGPLPEHDPKDPGDWVQIELKPAQALPSPVALSTLKSTKSLSKLLLLKQSRLSVSPVTAAEFKTICELGDRS